MPYSQVDLHLPLGKGERMDMILAVKIIRKTSRIPVGNGKLHHAPASC